MSVFDPKYVEGMAIRSVPYVLVTQMASEKTVDNKIICFLNTGIYNNLYENCVPKWKILKNGWFYE